MATLAMFLCRRGEGLVDLNFDHIHLREDHWAVLTPEIEIVYVANFVSFP